LNLNQRNAKVPSAKSPLFNRTMLLTSSIQKTAREYYLHFNMYTTNLTNSIFESYWEWKLNNSAQLIIIKFLIITILTIKLMSLLTAPKSALYTVYKQSTELEIFCGATANYDPGRWLFKFLDHTESEDSSVQVISTSHRPLPTQHTANTTDEKPCLQWNSNHRPQKSTAA